MHRLTEAFTNRGIGEEVSEEWHYPRYTEGCWGKPGSKLCWVCKFRVPVAILRLFRRDYSSAKSNSNE